MEYRFRTATLDDVASMIKLWNKNLDVLFRPFKSGIMKTIDNYTLVVNETDELIGFISYSIKTRLKEFRLEHMAIAEEFRSQGIRTALIEYMKGLNENGYPITLDCVYQARNNSFWNRLGEIQSVRTLPSGMEIARVKLK